MATVEELERQVGELEAALVRCGLAGPTAKAGQWFPGSLQVVRADADGDGDFDPYTSSSWDGDSFSTGTGTIDWNEDFAVPDGARLVFVDLQVRDSDSANTACSMNLRAKSTTTNPSLGTGNMQGKTNDTKLSVSGVVPVAQDGTSYYSITASGEDTFDAWLRVPAYAR